MIVHDILVSARGRLLGDCSASVVSGDDNVHVLSIRVMDGERDTDYGLFDAVALRFKRADNIACEGIGQLTASGVVYTLQSAELAVPGALTCEVRLYSADGSRLTTAQFAIQVRAGLDGPVSVPGELNTLAQLITQTQAQMSVVQGWIDNPAQFKGDQGEDGTSFTLLGLYPTLAALQAAHPFAAVGDAYAVGSTGENHVYVYGEGGWTDFGRLQGPAGPNEINAQTAAAGFGEGSYLGSVGGKASAMPAPIPASQKGAANGVASLDAGMKVPLDQLPQGAGNGLDADKLDGKHANEFAQVLSSGLVAPTWYDMVLQNGATVSGRKPQYCKVNGVVYFRGNVAINTTADIQFTTLPVGYRPGLDSNYGSLAPSVSGTGVNRGLWFSHTGGLSATTGAVGGALSAASTYSLASIQPYLAEG